MTIAVSNTTLSNTFSHWLARTNEIAHALSTKVVSTDSNTAIGNAAISGTFTANIVSCNTMTASDGSIDVVAANLTIQATGGLVTLGVVNIKSDLVIDAVSKIRIPGANATHTFLTVNSVTGNAEFARILIPIDQITDVDTTNATKTDTSMLMWNTGTGKWQTNTISLINTTRINTLNVGSISSTLIVSGNTTLSNSTVFVNGTNQRVGINQPSPAASLHVNGTILASGDIAGFQTSDRFFKKNINVYADSDSLQNILQLDVKEFDWDDKKVKKSKFVSPLNTGHDVGLIAQEVQELHPAWVSKREDDTLAINYDKLIPYLIGAIKQLHKELKEVRGDGG